MKENRTSRYERIREQLQTYPYFAEHDARLTYVYHLIGGRVYTVLIDDKTGKYAIFGLRPKMTKLKHRQH